MGGNSKQETRTVTDSNTDPWAPSQPLLKDIIGQLRGQVGNTAVTGTETSALNRMLANAQSSPDFSGDVGMLAKELFGGGQDRTGIVSDAYRDLQSGLGATARGDFLDQNKNPYSAGMLDTVGNDITNRINSMFAGAGRDLSGAHMGALGRGISEGTAPILAGMYENERGRQLGALNQLYGAGIQTAGTLSGLDQTALGNRATGMQVAGALPAFEDMGANRELAAEAMRRGLPLQNIGMLEQLAVPMGQLGQQSHGVSTSTQTASQPLGQQIAGTAIGGLGLLGGLGAFGAGGWLYGGPKALLSDERFKENIEPVGMLFDGQLVHSYNYVGDNTPQIGLLAQEVEQVRPDAVIERGGVKFVDYDRATERASAMAA